MSPVLSSLVDLAIGATAVGALVCVYLIGRVDGRADAADPVVPQQRSVSPSEAFRREHADLYDQEVEQPSAAAADPLYRRALEEVRDGDRWPM